MNILLALALYTKAIHSKLFGADRPLTEAWYLYSYCSLVLVSAWSSKQFLTCAKFFCVEARTTGWKTEGKHCFSHDPHEARSRNPPQKVCGSQLQHRTTKLEQAFIWTALVSKNEIQSRFKPLTKSTPRLLFQIQYIYLNPKTKEALWE